jgi:uncharacterized protein
MRTNKRHLTTNMLSIEQYRVLHATEEFVKQFMKDYDDSHDFAHVLRVKHLATVIAQSEGLSTDETFQVQLAALTHDIHDHKYTDDLIAQEIILEEFFSNKLSKDDMKEVIKIACNVSLSKETVLEHNNIFINCKKLDCVRDADRIDSLGSIGITRYFSYGIRKNKSNIHDIMQNIELRTDVLIKHIKTKLGKQIANKKYRLIQEFLEDYKLSI